MKKKSLFTLMKVAIAVAVVLLMMLPVSVLADDAVGYEGGEVNSEEYGMTMSKYARVQNDGTYIIDLDAFATGQVIQTVETAPADIILVLDVSGSMEDHMYTYTARASQGYSYNSVGNNTYYYLHSDGKYYRVNRDGRRLYFTANSRNYYLSGTSVINYRPSQAASNTTTIWTGVLYQDRKDEGQKMAALKTAVKSFLDIVAEKNAAEEVASDTNKQSRVAIVKFAGNAYDSNYSNYSANGGNHTYQDGRYTYNNTEVVKDLALVNDSNLGNDTSTGTNTWKGSVNALNYGGSTAADYGMGYAKAIFDRHQLTPTDIENGRSRVVVMFTDGEPNHYTDFWGGVAADTVNSAKAMKADDVTVFTVAILAGADPSQDPGTTNVNQYLHAVSSNYKTATATSTGSEENATFDVTWGERTKNEDGTNKNHYFTATTADQLEGIFAAIAHSSGSSGSTVNATAVLTDIVSSSFTLPDGASTNIDVKIVRWNSHEHRWGTADDTDEDGPYVFTTEDWKTKSTTYGAETQETVTVQIEGSNVNVSGFDYAKHFKATKASEDNDAVDTVHGVNKFTAKIVISFEIDAKPSAITGGKVATNGEDSGLYVDGKLVIKFPQPDVVFTPVTYVVDYVTSDTSTDTKASTVKLDYTDVLSDVDMLDKPDDDVLKGEYVEGFKYTIYKGKYGTISFGDDEVDVQRRYVRYAPTTMNWDSYDRIFVKGTSNSADEKDVWAMLCVLPANNVFYEDTYITQTKTVEYNNQSVTIEYTGIAYDEGKWSTVGTEGKNQTQHADKDDEGNPIAQGWIDGLADDSDYANDMAHMSSTAKAKASFSFSGTGVDIYSRINGSTGTISVKLQGEKDPETGKRITKTQILDNKAATGDFFATPVCTFSDLPYGKYTVTITVTTGGQKEGRMTFYLDGIRVYNPIKPLESEENVKQIYGEKNLGAVFTEVRSMLLADPAAAEAEALYIDEHTVSEIVPDVEAIEKAAKALADAQAERDAYVETVITPAKNDVSEEEYALKSAKDAVVNAQNIYNVAVAALAADPENEELQAAVTKAENDLSAAETARDNAQAHYDANIDDLNAALNTAIANRAPLDAAIEAKRQAYEDASQNTIELAYTTDDISLYEKEGPKHEVLLDKGQSVAISVESGKYYYVGLKSLKGNAVTAQIGSETVTLSHSADLYYEATPVSDRIIIKNVSEDNNAILSVTKLRTTGVDNNKNGMKLASTEETLNIVRNLTKMSVSDYAGEILSEEEITAEEAVDEEVIVEEPASEEETVVMLEESDITIENAEPATETETEPKTATADSSAESTLSRIMSSFSRFFRR